jgi:peptide-methionine (S)-S-oxide reductase
LIHEAEEAKLGFMFTRGLLFAAIFCMTAMSAETEKPASAAHETITLGAGCFWCTEAVYQQIPGVVSVKPGYMGGKTKNPTYEQVCTGQTGHNEVAQLVYNPAKVTLERILEVFWVAHDPTTLNRQGADVGTQYRSGIYYHTDDQRKIAEKSKAEAAAKFEDPIVTEIMKADVFYVAESYHHDYYRRNKDKNSYCQAVIKPKLRKLKLAE